MKDLEDVNFKAMHMDAMESLGALEQLLGNIHRLAAFSGEYLSKEPLDLSEEEKEMAAAEADTSDLTNVVDRTPKEERKKMAILKLSRFR